MSEAIPEAPEAMAQVLRSARYFGRKLTVGQTAALLTVWRDAHAERIVREHLANPLYSRRRLEERVAAADAMAEAIERHNAGLHPNDVLERLAAYRALSPRADIRAADDENEKIVPTAAGVAETGESS